jgi:hypothetical protein
MASPRRLRARMDASRRHKFIKLGPIEPDSFGGMPGMGSSITSDNYYERIGYPELRSKVEVNDVFITVEHCCACATHNGMSLRHDPIKYYKQSMSILRLLAKVQHTTHNTKYTSHNSNTRHTTHDNTHHTSHITNHTSHITHHTTHNTRHTSHNTQHTTHDTRHTTTHITHHITHHTSHISQHT